MSDQASSEEFAGPAGTGDGGDSKQGRGRGRRAVVLGAAAVGASAVAGMALPAGTAMASSEAVPRAGAGAPLSVEIAVHSSINLKEILDLVARVGGLAGCRVCGLGGIDLRLFAVDPVELKEIKTLEAAPGVASVVVFQQ